jgi:hypothetical protein
MERRFAKSDDDTSFPRRRASRAKRGSTSVG